MMKKIGWRRLRLATQLLFGASRRRSRASLVPRDLRQLPVPGLPLTDPFAAAQVLAAGGRWLAAAALGLVLVILLYLIFGRAFCAWVCPLGSLMEGVDWIGRGCSQPMAGAPRRPGPGGAAGRSRSSSCSFRPQRVRPSSSGSPPRRR